MHLDFALAGHRVIFSQDADFLSLAGQGHAHSGIAYARQHTSIGNIIGGLVLIHQVLSAEDMNGRIEYI